MEDEEERGRVLMGVFFSRYCATGDGVASEFCSNFIHCLIQLSSTLVLILIEKHQLLAVMGT